MTLATFQFGIEMRCVVEAYLSCVGIGPRQPAWLASKQECTHPRLCGLIGIEVRVAEHAALFAGREAGNRLLLGSLMTLRAVQTLFRVNRVRKGQSRLSGRKEPGEGLAGRYDE